MEVTQQKIQEAIANSSEWIAFLAAKSDKDLERRLGINRLQFAEAYKNKQEDVCELLELMRRLIMEARIYKEEHSIADSPNDIELAMAEHKRETKHCAERQKAFEPQAREKEEELKETDVYKTTKSKIKEEDGNQMSLF